MCLTTDKEWASFSGMCFWGGQNDHVMALSKLIMSSCFRWLQNILAPKSSLLTANVLKCRLILCAPLQVIGSRCSWIKRMLNMREVINYKPDVFTRCFCILALLVGHGCQCISSSRVCLRSLSPMHKSFSLAHTIIIHILFYLFTSILSSAGQQVEFILWPGAKMIRRECTVAQSHKLIKGLLVFCRPLSATSSKDI